MLHSIALSKGTSKEKTTQNRDLRTGCRLTPLQKNIKFVPHVCGTNRNHSATQLAEAKAGLAEEKRTYILSGIYAAQYSMPRA